MKIFCLALCLVVLACGKSAEKPAESLETNDSVGVSQDVTPIVSDSVAESSDVTLSEDVSLSVDVSLSSDATKS